MGELVQDKSSKHKLSGYKYHINLWFKPVHSKELKSI